MSYLDEHYLHYFQDQTDVTRGFDDITAKGHVG